MTDKEFMISIEACYDFSKKPGQIGLIAKWVQTIPKRRLDKLWASVAREIDTEFNQSPDLARVRKLYYQMVDSLGFVKPIRGQKQLEFDGDEHRKEIVQCFGELRENLGLPEYGDVLGGESGGS